jgi:hypothetical protein
VAGEVSLKTISSMGLLLHSEAETIAKTASHWRLRFLCEPNGVTNIAAGSVLMQKLSALPLDITRVSTLYTYNSALGYTLEQNE